MKPMNLANRWVLVTGASSGLGKAMAVQLARDHHANLILVARRLERLQELQSDLQLNHGVKVIVVQADLSRQEDVDRVYRESIAAGEVYALVLNAGITYFGRYQDMDWQTFTNMLSTNVTSVVRLVHLFLPYLKQKDQGGGILLISSMAGFLAVPYQTAYAGTKAFITNFGQSLYQELRGENLSITVFAPGGISTEMTQNSGLGATFDNTVFVQDADECAQEALAAMVKRTHIHVPGMLNKAQLFLSRAVPRKLLGFIAANAYRKALT